MNKLLLLCFLPILCLLSCTGTSSTENPDWTMLPFSKADAVNPVLTPGSGSFFCPIRQEQVAWEVKDVFNPALVVHQGKIMMLYRAEDSVGKYAGTSRIGLAESEDGLHFTRHAEPVFFPDNDAQKIYEWEGGCEDPRLVQTPGGEFIMTYTAYDGDKARLMIASSPDLRQWTKHGPAFQSVAGDPYTGKWSKSGAIVATYEPDGRIVATRIKDKFWMYWGDVNIMAATSDDLIHWKPVEYADSSEYPTSFHRNSEELKTVRQVFGPRPGKFDSDLVEPGPAARLTDKGILLIYNSRNLADGDPTLAEGTYTVAQVLLDRNDPMKVLDRMDTWFLKPDKPFETDGQVNQVCFAEGLVYFRNKWFLYYGTADSKIGVAVKEGY